MENRASLYYQALLKADPITQIGNIFLLLLTLFMLWQLLRSVYVITTCKLQKATVIGFKRRTRSFGRLLLPSYENKTTLKRTPLKNITAIDVFISSKEAKFIDLSEIGGCLLFGSLMTTVWLTMILGIDLPFEKILLGSALVMFILLFRSNSQFHYADRTFPGLRSWQQTKRDKEITKTELEEAEYQRLITPDKLLTYEEAKRLEDREGHWKVILGMAFMISLIGLMGWLDYFE